MKKWLIACALSATASLAQAQTLAPGQWKMRDPQQPVFPNCDIHQRLNLDATPLLGEFALLEDALVGTCYVYIPPNPRFVRLSYQGQDACGSSLWTGVSQTAEDKLPNIKITDHRTRHCDDAVQAEIVLERSDDYSGEKQTSYSSAR